MQKEKISISELKKIASEDMISIDELIYEIDNSTTFYIYQLTKELFAIHINKANFDNLPEEIKEIDVETFINLMQTNFDSNFLIGSVENNEYVILGESN